MNEPTPKPWVVEEASKYAYVQIPGAMSATIRIPLEDKAYAYWIAAAPEMLEALEEMMDVDSMEAGIWANEKARAAIAKAKGE